MENELYYQYDKRYFVKLDAQIRWYYERSIKHDRFSKFHKLNLIKLSSFKINDNIIEYDNNYWNYESQAGHIKIKLIVIITIVCFEEITNALKKIICVMTGNIFR